MKRKENGKVILALFFQSLPCGWSLSGQAPKPRPALPPECSEMRFGGTVRWLGT